MSYRESLYLDSGGSINVLVDIRVYAGFALLMAAVAFLLNPASTYLQCILYFAGVGLCCEFLVLMNTYRKILKVVDHD